MYMYMCSTTHQQLGKHMYIYMIYVLHACQYVLHMCQCMLHMCQCMLHMCQCTCMSYTHAIWKTIALYGLDTCVYTFWYTKIPMLSQFLCCAALGKGGSLLAQLPAGLPDLPLPSSLEPQLHKKVSVFCSYINAWQPSSLTSLSNLIPIHCCMTFAPMQGSKPGKWSYDCSVHTAYCVITWLVHY